MKLREFILPTGLILLGLAVYVYIIYYALGTLHITSTGSAKSTQHAGIIDFRTAFYLN